MLDIKGREYKIVEKFRKSNFITATCDEKMINTNLAKFFASNIQSVKNSGDQHFEIFRRFEQFAFRRCINQHFFDAMNSQHFGKSGKNVI